jgi:hypothetical protein
MDPTSVAASLLSSQMGQTQLTMALKMVKMNADQQSAVAQMVASVASQQASLPPGVGRNLDIAA